MNVPSEEHSRNSALSATSSRGGENNAFDSNEQTSVDDMIGVVEPLTHAPKPLSLINKKVSMLQEGSIPSMHSLLYTVPHLYTLNENHIMGLNLMLREYSAMDTIIDEGSLLTHVFVLVSGTVEVINTRVGRTSIVGHRRIGSISAPNIFGIDSVILEKPLEFSYHASSLTSLLLIPKRQFCELFALSSMFASSVSIQIVQTLSTFAVFEDFCRVLFGLSSTSVPGTRSFGEGGYKLSMPTSVSIYESSETVLHSFMHSTVIDIDALHYCVKRLPENITETFVITLSRSVPTHLSDGLGFSTTMSLEATRRRRGAWKIGENGQVLVMARDGFTDIIEFVTDLCMLIVESKKIRLRLQRLACPLATDFLRDLLAVADTASDATVKAVLSQLPFSEAEIDGLMQIWEGPEVIKVLYNILLRRGEFVVYVDVNLAKKFSQDPYQRWSLCINRHIREELGIGGEDVLPSDLTIDVMFSSNITIKSLLCSPTEEFRLLLEKYLALPAEVTALKNVDDRYLYALAQVLGEDTSVREKYRQVLEGSGFTMMEDSYISGLVVDLINISKLQASGIDATLRHAALNQQSMKGNGFIINIDRTFAAQVEIILRSLVLVFSDHIRSVNLTGSVSGLVGKRGDVVLPTKLIFSKQSFGEDSTDETRVCNTDDIQEEDVIPFLDLGSSALHRGGCVTLPGVFLYSDSVLRFYKVVHGCTSVDMRSSYVARQLEESRRTGMLKRGVKRRFLFHIDAVPLNGDGESEPKSKKCEVLFSIYATTRSLLRLILFF
ncbi:cyclic nucleotide-binding protein [Trypanosoma rangeli]|uniref:Cyclic nucleotide-binding protein n=1 Tax=Trypanosoma rangeli TaxID=5698 RepID=A0A3R7MMZ6_TRYRA|nr:cyclic nucleotide-binding protein [Trypanosoma rangeli]RNF05446.1 cyclic nucleotide-binding protein [Trypanosoma rangeli]|eukprot:RNF05446.1 cyclic nucleotide-binding protein [Trypanosoma rangeli]